METAQSVRFMRRVNLGNYEHAELEVTDVITDKSKSVSVVKGLMGFVSDALYDRGEFAKTATTASVKGPETAATKVEKPKAEPAKKVEGPKKETPKQQELPISEEKPLAADGATTPAGTTTEAKAPVEEAKAEAPAEEPKKEETKEKKTRKETTVKTKATKATVYDRNLDAHKNNLGAYLDKQFPGWRKPENLKKAGTASRELQGTDFLDGEGNILQSFKDAFGKHMVDLV